jgi:hypothetical protein
MRSDKEFRLKLDEYRDFEKRFIIKYGTLKRVYKLVSTETEIKFSKALMLFRNALISDDYVKKQKMLDMMYRAYDALETELLKLGYKPLEVNVKSFKFGKHIALICDYDYEKENMIAKHKNDKDVLFFSIEELFRCIPSEYMDYKALLTRKLGEVNFESIKYGQRR